MIYTFLCIYLSKKVCHAEIFWCLYERRFRIVAGCCGSILGPLAAFMVLYIVAVLRRFIVYIGV